MWEYLYKFCCSILPLKYETQNLAFRGIFDHFRFVLGDNKIRWLGEEALRRYLKLKPPSFVPNREEAVLDIRKTAGGAILDPEDTLKHVLDDNDFVSIGKKIKLKLAKTILKDLAWSF